VIHAVIRFSGGHLKIPLPILVILLFEVVNILLCLFGLFGRAGDVYTTSEKVTFHLRESYEKWKEDLQNASAKNEVSSKNQN